MSNSNGLKWRFDISAYRLLGRELITDKITAVFELVKNAYDANAHEVDVEFLYEETRCVGIKIIDDGIGMTKDDIENKWMVIGSSYKRQNSTSPPPERRKFVGKKGIGRFAIDKLGSYLLMTTRPKGSNQVNELIIDWGAYESEEERQLKLFEENTKKLFTEVENDFQQYSEKKEMHGTELLIKNVREQWDKHDIETLVNELSKLASPFAEMNSPFDMYVTAKPHGYNRDKIESQAVKYATHKFELSYDLKRGIQERLAFDEATGQMGKSSTEIESFGPARMVIHYFDRSAKRKFRKETVNQKIDGIKIYRDGIITTPFAENTKEVTKQKDLFGLDKRRWSGFFDKISSPDLIGYIELTGESNSDIIETTNRQGFIQNHAFIDLRKFVIKQIAEIEKFINSKKAAARKTVDEELSEAQADLKRIIEMTGDLRTQVGQTVKPKIAEVSKNLRTFQRTFKKQASEFREQNKEKVRQENLFFSLMSLQEYASEISHIVRTSIGKISRHVKFFYDEYPNPEFDYLYIEYSKIIYEELIALNNALDFMLSYSKSNVHFELINISKLLDNLKKVAYTAVLGEKKIQLKLDIDPNIEFFHNKKFFEDIFQNLIDNSIKALGRTEKSDKTIIVKGRKKDSNLIFNVIDNGPGVDQKIAPSIYNVFFTTTADDDGAGIGLFSVKKRVKAMKGTITLMENPYFQTGANFEISLPTNSQ